jgi:hypothetical protein
MIKYSVAMGIRMVCIVLMLFVHGWWLLLCAVGAILLPYFAVVVANVHGAGAATAVVRPGAVELYRGPSTPRPEQPSGRDTPRQPEEAA